MYNRQDKSVKRAFITFSEGDEYNKICEVLKKSIEIFSEYPLVVYSKKDFNIDMSSPDFWKDGRNHILKILSCIKSLEDYDEVVWIDSDCIATNYIDKIWFETWRLKKFPLLPKYRFSLFGKNIENVEPPMQDQIRTILQKSEVKAQIPHTDRVFYSQACFMLFNKSCLDFFKLTEYYFKSYDPYKFPYRIFEHGAFGDESIINYLFWKNNYIDNLGEIFTCSHFFDLTAFSLCNNREQFMNAFTIRPEVNCFENILFVHGTKSVDRISGILNNLISTRIL